MVDPLELRRAIRRFQSGSDRERGLRLLYDSHFGVVRGFFAGRGFRPEEAEELAQDTFVRVYKGLDRYDHRDRFGAWLFTVAENVCRQEWQRRGSQKRRGHEVPLDAAEAPDKPPDGMPSQPAKQEEAVMGEERRRRLQEGIRELPSRQRQCLALYARDLSYRQIATVLQIAPETVKQHLMAARRNLRKQLADLRLDLEDETL